MSVVPQSDVLGTVAQDGTEQVPWQDMGYRYVKVPMYILLLYDIVHCKIATFYNFLFTGEKEEMEQEEQKFLHPAQHGSDEELLVD